MIDRRKRARRTVGGLFGAGVLGALAASPAPAYAAQPSVALGEVSTRVVRSDVDLGEVLRAAMQDQLDTLEAPRGKKGPLILSASLVRMETDGGRLTCVVSATLRTALGGTMIAIVEGRAGLEIPGPASASLVRQAVAAAARSAMVRVPDALR